jgi:5-methylcytosine-specific restriction endonuclease McrA
MKTLLLNQDNTPLKVICWQKCIILCLKGVITPIDYWERIIKDSMGRKYPLPRVAILHKYVKRPRGPALSKKNIFIRDRNICGYCHKVLPTKDLTVDHIIPSSRGGKNTWGNLITACVPCNRKKGNKTPEEAKMNLVKPKSPQNILDLTEFPEYIN